MLKSRHPL